jgi:rare lipoprotein A
MQSKLVSLVISLVVLIGSLVLAVPEARAPRAVSNRQPIEPLSVWDGTASWYGPGFHGRQTANGEIYDMYEPTAAHLQLPLGSIVRLVNPETGQSRVVRINDRGPYVEGREIDVSYEVARSLGFEEQGLARVRIELLKVPTRRWKPQPIAD